VSFGERLVAAVERFGPLCAGIDPHPALLAEWGLTDDAAGLAAFCSAAVEALAGHVAAVKPQSAFFERHGSRGIAVLEDVLAGLAGSGTLSVLDVKRGDIGSTMDGYADAYLGVGAAVAADAITVSPYLGFGSLEPAFRAASDAGRGVIVLARTSNPEGAGVQLATTVTALDAAGSATVAQSIVDGAAARNAGVAPLGSVGVVVGATHDHGLDLSALNGAVLAPGLGAQGATPADLAERFGGLLGVLLPAASRSILEAGPSVPALRGAAESQRDALAEALTVLR
jgi:orotidine-5'-phosphate decarboxylase